VAIGSAPIKSYELAVGEHKVSISPPTGPEIKQKVRIEPGKKTKIGGVAAVAAADKGDPEKVYEEARDLYARGLYQQAYQLAKSLLSRSPVHPSAHRLAAMSACGTKDAKAVQALWPELDAVGRNAVANLCARSGVAVPAKANGP
jgi:hypothetical protein